MAVDFGFTEEDMDAAIHGDMMPIPDLFDLVNEFYDDPKAIDPYEQNAAFGLEAPSSSALDGTEWAKVREEQLIAHIGGGETGGGGGQEEETLANDITQNPSLAAESSRTDSACDVAEDGSGKPEHVDSDDIAGEATISRQPHFIPDNTFTTVLSQVDKGLNTTAPSIDDVQTSIEPAHEEGTATDSKFSNSPLAEQPQDTGEAIVADTNISIESDYNREATVTAQETSEKEEPEVTAARHQNLQSTSPPLPSSPPQLRDGLLLEESQEGSQLPDLAPAQTKPDLANAAPDQTQTTTEKPSQVVIEPQTLADAPSELELPQAPKFSTPTMAAALPQPETSSTGKDSLKEEMREEEKRKPQWWRQDPKISPLDLEERKWDIAYPIGYEVPPREAGSDSMKDFEDIYTPSKSTPAREDAVDQRETQDARTDLLDSAKEVQADAALLARQLGDAIPQLAGGEEVADDAKSDAVDSMIMDVEPQPAEETQPKKTSAKPRKKPAAKKTSLPTRKSARTSQVKDTPAESVEHQSKEVKKEALEEAATTLADVEGNASPPKPIVPKKRKTSNAATSGEEDEQKKPVAPPKKRQRKSTLDNIAVQSQAAADIEAQINSELAEDTEQVEATTNHQTSQPQETTAIPRALGELADSWNDLGKSQDSCGRGMRRRGQIPGQTSEASKAQSPAITNDVSKTEVETTNANSGEGRKLSVGSVITKAEEPPAKRKKAAVKNDKSLRQSFPPSKREQAQRQAESSLQDHPDAGDTEPAAASRKGRNRPSVSKGELENLGIASDPPAAAQTKTSGRGRATRAQAKADQAAVEKSQPNAGKAAKARHEKKGGK
jgi:hypothetical protein